MNIIVIISSPLEDKMLLKVKDQSWYVLSACSRTVPTYGKNLFQFSELYNGCSLKAVASAENVKRACKIYGTAETELKSSTVKLHQRHQSPTLLRESWFEQQFKQEMSRPYNND